MRNLVYSIQVSLDGYIAREDHTYDFLIAQGDHYDMLLQNLRRYDTALMGRLTYEVGVKDGVVNPDLPLKQFVVSGSLDKTIDEKIRLIQDDVISVISSMKDEEGESILLSGGGRLASALLQENLIDEIELLVHPVFIGEGIPVFQSIGSSDLKLKLKFSKTCGSGVMLLAYSIIKSKTL